MIGSVDGRRRRVLMLGAWLRHRVNSILGRLNELVTAAQQPWPVRLAAIDAVAARPQQADVGTGPRVMAEISAP